mgnify:FL=1
MEAYIRASYGSGRVMLWDRETGEEFVINQKALYDFLEQRFTLDDFKNAKLLRKYKNMDYDQTYKLLTKTMEG